MALIIHAKLKQQSTERLLNEVEFHDELSEVLVPIDDINSTRDFNPGNVFIAERVAARVAYLLDKDGVIPTTFSIFS